MTTTYFLYGESIIYYFQEVVLVDRVLLPFATHHRFISFLLYVIGKLSVELKLEKLSLSFFIHRFYVFRGQLEKGTIQATIPSVWLDAYGSSACRVSKSLYCEQYLGGLDLVHYFDLFGYLQ